MMRALSGTLSKAENQAIYKDLKAFNKGVTELSDLIQEIEDTDAVSSSADKFGPAADKAKAAQLLGDGAFEIASAVHACAVDSGNDALALTMDFSRSDVTRGRDGSIVQRCQGILNTATELVDSLGDYGVTTAKLNTLKKRVEGFDALRSKPREGITAGSAATKRVPKLFRKATVLLARKLDRLAVQFKESEPEFYAQYKAARVVVDAAVARSAKTKKSGKVTPATDTSTPKAA